MNSAETRGLRGPLQVCLWSLLLTAVAILVRLAIAPVTGSAVPFVTCFAAAVCAAWFFGFWAAALSVLVSATAGAYYILGAQNITNPWPTGSDRVAIAGFAVIALAVCWLIDFQHRILVRAHAAEGSQRHIATENASLLAEARAARNQLTASVAELRRANQDLEAFAYSVSHDLQEPVRTISIYAQLLQQKHTELSDDDSRSLSEIVGGARQMTTLIRDILTYTRSSLDENESLSPTDSGGVVLSILDTLKPMIQGTGAVVTVHELPAAAMHPTRLAQVFQNLIVNALKYRAGAPPRIDIAGEVRHGYCIFSVSDNGIGIEPEYSEKIFELFKRLHPQHVISGSGVGLALCRRIVEQSNGRIWLERSTPGEGSVFCFSVPTGRPESAA